jgi:hypothetical protein
VDRHKDITHNHLATQTTLQAVVDRHKDITHNHLTIQTTLQVAVDRHKDITHNHLTIQTTLQVAVDRHKDITHNHLTKQAILQLVLHRHILKLKGIAKVILKLKDIANHLTIPNLKVTLNHKGLLNQRCIHKDLHRVTTAMEIAVLEAIVQEETAAGVIIAAATGAIATGTETEMPAAQQYPTQAHRIIAATLRKIHKCKQRDKAINLC